MKKLYTTIILALAYINVNAQAPGWAWANGAGGTGAEAGFGINTDASGNVYVIGFYFSPSITFGTTMKNCEF